MRVAAVAVAAAVLVSTSGVEAREKTVSYALPIVAVDAALAATTVTSLATVHLTKEWALTTLSLALYSVGAPIVHLAHERPGAALASLGLHTVLPTASAYLLLRQGVCLDDRTGADEICTSSIYGGLLLGMAVATTIDALALAHEAERPARTAPASAPGPAPAPAPWETVTPVGWISPGAGFVGLSGAF
ncbi:MAG: hypothetical protein HYV09_28280 [Deltaproteobacteria bacterium]|nr:hypothetical protein [Deltaproteobacteria bacterium]